MEAPAPSVDGGSTEVMVERDHDQIVLYREVGDHNVLIIGESCRTSSDNRVASAD